MTPLPSFLPVATAWGGYLAHGRGAVLMRRNKPAAPTFEYQAGAPCDCHDGLVNDYDPSASLRLCANPDPS